ncbi:MAG: hypothetical protein KAI94_12525 [Anaerolineales bacterium]|nr:hypothetical protein [Anaerolineales bacterium]
MDDFHAFIEAMRGKRLLHLGHKDADCDAVGSAYALSCILPGDIARSRHPDRHGLVETCKRRGAAPVGTCP